MEPRDGILRAAHGVFARHGFRQTAMAMVAEEAGLSRQALYHHFASKEALFAALVDELHETALAAAKQAAASPREFADSIVNVFHAYHASLLSRLGQSPFTAELVEESGRQCAAAVAAFRERFESILEGVIARAVRSGDLTLRAGIRARDVVNMVQIAAKGLKGDHAGGAAPSYGPALERMITVICSGVAAPAGVSARRKATQTGKARRTAR